MSQDLFAPSSTDRARALADALLSIDAVSLRPHDPFTWSSGLAAPIYCDNRQTLAHPSVRERIADGFAEAVREYDGTSLTVAGTARGGASRGHGRGQGTRLSWWRISSRRADPR